ncbi:hypothetical protein IE81DRAFT_127294 [Ceraceosorus guamensis]|uniref:Uncharacterized protein n=1 Tax=Ceraceosorus guamensis TaxID=1522189 RepID=A0A316W7M2_9BASI|nr:hypothetical protein IE81DRAFT_127294 [Ceraceosorus guamensis]PWN45822.1 hypothetical protein IE81DRAFT_127294 [Ceraceosorus guamensis]
MHQFGSLGARTLSSQLAYESLEQQRHAFHALNGRLGLGMRLRPAIRHPRWLPDERAGAELAWTAEPVRRDSRPVTDHTTSKERTRSPVKQSRGAELKSSTSGAQRRRASRQQAEERFAAKRKRLQQALADLDREERRSKRSSRSKRESISPPSKKSRSSGKSKREPPSSPKRTSKRNEGSKREHLSSHRPASRRSSRSDREPENAGKSARARLSGRVTPPMDRVKRHMPPEQAVAQEDSLTMARISQSQKRPLVGVTPERALPPSEVAPWLDRTTWAMSTRAVGTGSNTFALAAHRNGHWSFPSPSDAAHAESQSSEVYAMGGGQPLGDASVNVSPSRRMPVFSPAPPEPGVPSVVPTGLVSAAEDDDAPSSNFPNGTAESDSCPSLRHPTLDSDARAAFDFPAGPDSQTEGHASQVLCTSANSSRALRKDFAIAGQSRTGKALYVRFA